MEDWTFFLLYPSSFGAHRDIGKMLTACEKIGLNIIGMRLMCATRKFLTAHFGRDGRNRCPGESLPLHLTPYPFIAMVLEGDDAIYKALQLTSETSVTKPLPFWRCVRELVSIIERNSLYSKGLKLVRKSEVLHSEARLANCCSSSEINEDEYGIAMLVRYITPEKIQIVNNGDGRICTDNDTEKIEICSNLIYLGKPGDKALQTQHKSIKDAMVENKQRCQTPNSHRTNARNATG
ncbi:hypothetical protein C5167_014948 [Papaver somniferum]|uniref:Uncharacterized protein n=1 Tax=Papaver somniferum TaxID=3469 RepID=A0A4Y7J4P1_PAPSO|nr:hypothetical protein C5167_014948 [Papaver somniferum]